MDQTPSVVDQQAPASEGSAPTPSPPSPSLVSTEPATFLTSSSLDEIDSPATNSSTTSSSTTAVLTADPPLSLDLAPAPTTSLPPPPSSSTRPSSFAPALDLSSNDLHNHSGASLVQSKFGTRKVRPTTGSNISRRISMLAAGKTENNSDLHTVPSIDTESKKDTTGETTPDPNDYPDSFFEDLLRSDQTTIARSFTTMPKTAPRSTKIQPSTTMPIRLPSTHAGSKQDNSAEAPFILSGNLDDDLKRLQTELAKTKDTKAKAEADAKAQRVTVMSLKTEVQLVRNVLKRRETELGDVKDMSSVYEQELAELRQKLEKAERQLSKGQGEMEAKVRSLERLRDESITRIQTLDVELKKLKDQLKTAEQKTFEYEAQIHDMKEELEELTPYREAANKQREMTVQAPAKILELTGQITELEDTRDIQAALIEELETKITTVEAEALEFKGKAELEYEALSDGFKVLKTRRSEEIKVLKAELEQHKLQETIIEKLQSDIDQLQAALALVANSQTTENARINQVTAELNEALALKDQEVVQVRQNMTEFEESHNRLVSSLQATLATINEEADSARKSRDEAVAALESLKEELEALRHSLPINNKHMSLSEWSAEQQQLQQEQLKVIQELEEKLDGQVEGVREDQQRAEILEANTKRKSQQLSLDLEHHLQLSSAIVATDATGHHELSKKVEDESVEAASFEPESEVKKTYETIESPIEPGSVSVRTMLKFLSQLQGRTSDLLVRESHLREGTEATLAGDSVDDYETQLRAYLLQMDDSMLMEPWAKEKELEGEIDRLEQKIQTLLSELSVAELKGSEAQVALKDAQAAHEAQLAEERQQRDHLELLEREEREEIERELEAERKAKAEELSRQQLSLQTKEEELTVKESTLRSKETELFSKEQGLESKESQLESREQDLVAKAQELESKEIQQANEEKERRQRQDSFPATPPFSAPITPYGSPNNANMLPELLAAHHRSLADIVDDGEDEESRAATEEKKAQEELERQQQAEMAQQQIKLIKSLEEKILELEKRASLPSMDEQQLQNSFPSPPMSVTSSTFTPPQPRLSVSGSVGSGSTLSRIGSQSMRSSLLGNPPDTPPPTIALPPIPATASHSLDFGEANSSRSCLAASDDGMTPRTKKSNLAHSVSSESLSKMNAAIDAAVAAAVSKTLAANRELSQRLQKSEAELIETMTQNKELEAELTTVLQTNVEATAEVAKAKAATEAAEIKAAEAAAVNKTNSPASAAAATSSADPAKEQQMQRLEEENREMKAMLDQVRRDLDQALGQVKGLEGAKTQLEAQVQKERQAKDEAKRTQDRLQSQLEEEMQKKKGFLCF